MADDIFGFKTYLMKPYPGSNLTESQKVFNYRLSRCRRVIENAFGILSARWRIFRRPIKAKPCNVDSIVKACVCLHNYLQLTDNAHYVPKGFVDREDGSGAIIPGDWRLITCNNSGGMRCLLRRINKYGNDSKTTKESFEKYFNSRKGSVAWQLKHVRNCGEDFATATYNKEDM